MDALCGANTKSGTLTLGDKNFKFPLYEGTVGPEVLDISKLFNQAGIFTYDPGFTSTACCESKITYIDGDAGVLLYRGYPIQQLAEHGDFLETCYLLLYGELPSATQKAKFDYIVTRHTMVHEQMSRFFQGFRRDAHPMAVMVGSVGALSAFYHDSTDISDPVQRDFASIRMVAKLPTLAAMAYKYSIGQPFVYPKNELDNTSGSISDRLATGRTAECEHGDRRSGRSGGGHTDSWPRGRAARRAIGGSVSRLRRMLRSRRRPWPFPGADARGRMWDGRGADGRPTSPGITMCWRFSASRKVSPAASSP